MRAHVQLLVCACLHVLERLKTLEMMYPSLPELAEHSSVSPSVYLPSSPLAWWMASVASLCLAEVSTLKSPVDEQKPLALHNNINVLLRWSWT